jgi:hypothetical protein
MTKIDIINLALIKIGANRLATSQDAERGAICDMIYDNCLDSIAAEFPWRALRKRVTLQELAIGPAFEYLYYHQLPSDFKRLYKLFSGDLPETTTTEETEEEEGPQ